MKAFKKLVLMVACCTFGFGAVAETVAKSERALIVVSELDSGVPQELRGLYQVIEQLTQISVQGILGGAYDRIELLTGTQATYAEFKETIDVLADRYKTIDLIMSLHGSTGRLLFDDGSMRTSTMADRFYADKTPIQKILLRKKLRMVYNLSCFGASHRADFLRMGFDMVNGSVGINANSEVEFVPAMIAWANGIGFRDSFNGTNNDVALAIADGPVKLAGQLANNSLKDTNSKKLFSGKTVEDINKKISQW